MKAYLLPDELKELTQKAESLANEYKEAWKRAGEACSQSSETWHDNFEFDDANRAMQLASKKMWEVQKIMNAIHIVHSVLDDKMVTIGKRVKISIDSGDVKEYIIWGYQTLVSGRVGYSAPLIQSILWKKEWDIVETTLHGKEQEIEIIEVDVGVEIGKK